VILELTEGAFHGSVKSDVKVFKTVCIEGEDYAQVKSFKESFIKLDKGLVGSYPLYLRDLVHKSDALTL
jgi:hypothetical protein